MSAEAQRPTPASPSPSSLSLSPLRLSAGLGLELDAARQARSRSRSSGGRVSNGDAAFSEIGPVEEQRRSLGLEVVHGTMTTKTTDIREAEGEASPPPYPLCLLCLVRPPSAVLLPCCHLNLCYLCAPLLLHRATRPMSEESLPTPSTQLPRSAIIAASLLSANPHDGPPESEPRGASPPQSESQSERLPWHVILARATRNNPKARRLSMGGQCQVEGEGGEMKGADILPGTGGVMRGVCGDIEEDGAGDVDHGDAADKRIGRDDGLLGAKFSQSAEQRGRVVLDLEPSRVSDVGGAVGARCLVCRAGVKGWLRVYTG